MQHIDSSDPLKPPIIDPKYLSWEFDTEQLVAGYHTIQRLIETKSLQTIVDSVAFPIAKLENDEAIKRYALLIYRQLVLRVRHFPVIFAKRWPWVFSLRFVDVIEHPLIVRTAVGQSWDGYSIYGEERTRRSASPSILIIDYRLRTTCYRCGVLIVESSWDSKSACSGLQCTCICQLLDSSRLLATTDHTHSHWSAFTINRVCDCWEGTHFLDLANYRY